MNQIPPRFATGWRCAMGATNAIRAFDQYAGLVPPVPLLLLVRMALLSKDTDPSPWYGDGHAALARMALGRGRHAEVSKTDLKAVQRGMESLRKIGAVTISRLPAVRADDHDTTRYQLHLGPAREIHHGGRSASTVKTAAKVVSDPPRGTLTVHREESSRSGTVDAERAHGGRSAGRTVDGERPPKETRGDTEETHKSACPPVAKILRFPTGELVPVTAVPLTENAGTITAAWIDHCKANDVILPRDLVGRYAQSIKKALDDGFPSDLIKRALARMLADGQVSWPGSFAAHLVRVQETPKAQPKPSTTDQRVAMALAAGEEAQRIYDAAQAAKIQRGIGR